MTDHINTPAISDRDRVLALVRAEQMSLKLQAEALHTEGRFISASDLRARADQCDVLYAKIDALLMGF